MIETIRLEKLAGPSLGLGMSGDKPHHTADAMRKGVRRAPPSTWEKPWKERGWNRREGCGGMTCALHPLPLPPFRRAARGLFHVSELNTRPALLLDALLFLGTAAFRRMPLHSRVPSLAQEAGLGG